MGLNIMNKEDLFAKAIAAHTASRYADAERLYKQVIQMDPKYAGAYQNLGVLAFQVGRNDAAIPLLRQAISLSPNNAAMYCNLGDAYTAMRQGDDALACYKKAVELDPDMATTHNNLGIVYSRLGRVEDAIKSWKKAIELSNRPLGNSRVLIGTGGSGVNPESERKSLAAAAYNNLGNAYLQQIELDKALECHRIACEMNISYANARSNMLRDYTHIPNLDPAMLLAEHRKWWEIHGKDVKPMPHTNSREPDRKLRIGFVSPDFREHSVTHFLLPLFENIDKSQFEFVCYAGVNRPDEFTQMLARHAPLFRNALGAQDDELAKLAQDDKIDILFDLSGHTSDHRLRVFCYKPAPVQATFLGYPMTTGAPQAIIDYRLADPIADPPGLTDSHYSEKLWRLPKTMWCYRPPVNIPAEEVPPCVRDPKQPFTFGSFNNCSKMSELTFRMWAKVLHATPGSRLLLKASAMADDNTKQIILSRFAKQDIPAERIAMVPQLVDLAKHFAYYGNIDLALDTYTYNGTTTTCEAMWMNVPVVTMVGDMHISRVGASLLTNMGLPQLVTHTEEEFVKVASGYAHNRDALVALRKGLRARLQNSPVMDGKAFAADFGAALRGMWKQWCEKGK
jgi:protein O-GlcNAc transferase